MCVCFVSWTWSGGRLGALACLMARGLSSGSPAPRPPPPPRLPAPRPCSAKLAAWRCQPLTHLPLKPEPWPFQPRPAPFPAFRPTPSLRPQDPHAAAGIYPLPPPPRPVHMGAPPGACDPGPNLVPLAAASHVPVDGLWARRAGGLSHPGRRAGPRPQVLPTAPTQRIAPQRWPGGGGGSRLHWGRVRAPPFQGAGSQVGLDMLSPKHGLRRPHPNASPAPKAEPKKGTFSDPVSGQAHPACCVGGG